MRAIGKYSFIWASGGAVGQNSTTQADFYGLRVVSINREPTIQIQVNSPGQGGLHWINVALDDLIVSPTTRLYLAVKLQAPENVLLAVKLGDFYEFWFQDAETAACILEVTLTRRNNIPMAGFPYYKLPDVTRAIELASLELATFDA